MFFVFFLKLLTHLGPHGRKHISVPNHLVAGDAVFSGKPLFIGPVGQECLKRDARGKQTMVALTTTGFIGLVLIRQPVFPVFQPVFWSSLPSKMSDIVVDPGPDLADQIRKEAVVWEVTIDTLRLDRSFWRRSVHPLPPGFIKNFHFVTRSTKFSLTGGNDLRGSPQGKNYRYHYS
jgi:hypothetical protein